MGLLDRFRKKEEEEKSEEKGELFTLENFIKRYPEVENFLKKHGDRLYPNGFLNNLERDGIKEPDHREVYILARGTTEEINKFWEEKYSDLKTPDGKKITGIYVANVLRECFRRRLTDIHMPETRRISEEKAMDLFPKLEELYKGPEKILVYQG